MRGAGWVRGRARSSACTALAWTRNRTCTSRRSAAAACRSSARGRAPIPRCSWASWSTPPGSSGDYIDHPDGDDVRASPSGSTIPERTSYSSAWLDTRTRHLERQEGEVALSRLMGHALREEQDITLRDFVHRSAFDAPADLLT